MLVSIRLGDVYPVVCDVGDQGISKCLCSRLTIVSASADQVVMTVFATVSSAISAHAVLGVSDVCLIVPVTLLSMIVHRSKIAEERLSFRSLVAFLPSGGLSGTGAPDT